MRKARGAEVENILIKHGYMEPRKTPCKPKRKKSGMSKTVKDDDEDQDM